MIEFNPINFVKYLQYMGIGMLGVFLIIGIIIGATYLINLSTNKISSALEERKNNKDGE